MAAKIAIFNADHLKENLKKWGDFADMAITMLEQSKEPGLDVEYVVFQVHKNEFPSLEELKKGNYVGIYITGSESDSFDTHTEWIINLRKIMYTILTEPDFPPVAGVCFGHQIVPASLNCKVHRNNVGFEGGMVPVELTTEALKYGLFQKSGRVPTNSITIGAVHSDIVYEIPKGYFNILTSPKCEIHGLYKKNRVLTLQGHPEFTTDVVMICAENAHKKKLLKREELEHLKAQASQLGNDGIFASKYIWKLFYGEI